MQCEKKQQRRNIVIIVWKHKANCRKTRITRITTNWKWRKEKGHWMNQASLDKNQCC